MYDIKKVWSDWNIIRLIGEGSFGKVYEIERNQYGLKERSALKVITVPSSSAEIQSLRSEGMDDVSLSTYYYGVVQDFVQEIALMSKLKKCPGIVSYEDYAIYEHKDKMSWDILIRMELLTPLSQYLQSCEITESEACKIAADICDALVVCKENKVIHRDIKIENIFRTDEENYKLGDFGVARITDKTTGAMSKKGTYTYMAPEVYKGLPYNSSVDIYSLGMVLYKLLNYNREPFVPLPPASIKYNDKNEALVRRMGGEAISPPAKASPELAKIIIKMCAYKSEDRFTSPEEVKIALERTQRNNTAASINTAGVNYQNNSMQFEPNYTQSNTERAPEIPADYTNHISTASQNPTVSCYAQPPQAVGKGTEQNKVQNSNHQKFIDDGSTVSAFSNNIPPQQKVENKSVVNAAFNNNARQYSAGTSASVRGNLRNPQSTSINNRPRQQYYPNKNQMPRPNKPATAAVTKNVPPYRGKEKAAIILGWIGFGVGIELIFLLMYVISYFAFIPLLIAIVPLIMQIKLVKKNYKLSYIIVYIITSILSMLFISTVAAFLFLRVYKEKEALNQ